MSHVVRWFTNSPLRNYNHLIVSDVDDTCVVVDPFYPDQALEQAEKINKRIIAVLVTHEHADHYQGSKPLADKLDIPVYAHHSNESDIPRLDKKVREGDILDFSDDLKLHVIETPGHLKGHVCFYSERDHYVITGDVLFNAGIGRVAYKTSDVAQLLNSVSKLARLPDQTIIYPAHDYYPANLSFTKSIIELEGISNQLDLLSKQTPETRDKTSIQEEKVHNLFLRAFDHDVVEQVQLLSNTHQLSPGLETFKALRKLRDQW